jgi:hypothetical protein
LLEHEFHLLDGQVCGIEFIEPVLESQDGLLEIATLLLDDLLVEVEQFKVTRRRDVIDTA